MPFCTRLPASCIRWYRNRTTSRSSSCDERSRRHGADGRGLLAPWVAHFLTMYHGLRGTNLLPALFGSVLGIVGLGVLAAGALPHVSQAPNPDLYHAPGAPPEDRATQGILDALFGAGLLLVPVGLVTLGVAMPRVPVFGWVSMGLGVVGVIVASVLLVDPLSPSAFIGVLSLIVFHVVVGWKVYRLSRTPEGFSR